MMLPLSPAERRALRARAHTLAPVVMVSGAGLSDAVMGEIGRALAAHELIKVRTFSDDKNEREAWLTAICERLAAAPVQHIGKILVLYRPLPPASAKSAARKAGKRAPGPRKTKKQMLAAR